MLLHSLALHRASPSSTAAGAKRRKPLKPRSLRNSAPCALNIALGHTSSWLYTNANFVLRQALVLVVTQDVSVPAVEHEPWARYLSISLCVDMLKHMGALPGRLKEKNREAQKKYRERQKGKLQESEDKVSELTDQINALKVEKVCV